MPIAEHSEEFDLFTGVGELILLVLAVIGLVVLFRQWRHWVASQRSLGSVEELNAQKFALAEASVNLLERQELLEEQRRQLQEQKTLLETNREMLEQQKHKLAEVNQRLFQLNEELEQEKIRSEKLLLNVLPPQVAEELKVNGRTEPELFDRVTVLFSDLVDFTAQSARMTPAELIGELNDIFTCFDNIAEANGCERIKTIGDAYLAVCGMAQAQEEHAVRMLRCAEAMVEFLQERNRRGGWQWQIRIGVHCGSLVGGVVGVKKYIYDIFGDTVNTAARLEHHSEPMRINVSAEITAVAGPEFSFEPRLPVDVKGKGAMPMYFLVD